MTYNFLIAPDFAPERFAGWHMLNTLLQRHSDIGLHLLTPASHVEQEELIAQKDISIIYANPFDAAALIRKQGYRAIARPVGKSDEMVIAAAENSDIQCLEDIKAGSRVAMANNRDVKLIGLRLLEAVDLTEADLNFQITESYQAAAREVIKGEAEVAFFLADIFAGLSKLTHAQLNVLIESDLADISHVLLVKEDFEHLETIEKVILSLQELPEAQALLNELGFERGFEAMDGESAEFMIDLMETLLD
ncbi:PhnD/SsuA/transferrin family substrate-binding protein [Psychrobacter sp. I-STPA10]|uniref:PhnD/SsuA/transferrin family substrate-binding protein n=1 Tax=Psychrobacter sp. I-STPA10 TaxID=2585769 RepID=UPI001E48B2BA|nr:PhnD/SsuA/transferrin family substrate-binding protein [Psychrobacter sp. I-STPA10]